MIQPTHATRPQAGRPSGRPLILAIVLLGFALFYPYLDAAGLCGGAGCPHFVQSHAPAELPSATLAAVAAVAVPLLVRSFGPRPTSDRRPAQVYASPDPEPPRL